MKVAIIENDDVKVAAAAFLKKFDFIEFAILFGSFSHGKTTKLSDLDIGVYINKEISLLETGRLVAKLELALRLNVDIIILNYLYKRKPALAYEIVSKGNLLFCKNEARFIDFKKNVLIYFMDNKVLLDEVNKRFINRLNDDRFAEYKNDRKAKNP